MSEIRALTPNQKIKVGTRVFCSLGKGKEVTGVYAGTVDKDKSYRLIVPLEKYLHYFIGSFNCPTEVGVAYRVRAKNIYPYSINNITLGSVVEMDLSFYDYLRFPNKMNYKYAVITSRVRPDERKLLGLSSSFFFEAAFQNSTSGSTGVLNLMEKEFSPEERNLRQRLSRSFNVDLSKGMSFLRKNQIRGVVGNINDISLEEEDVNEWE